MEKTQNVTRKSFIPIYTSDIQWQRPQAIEQVDIDFETLHDNLSKKMKLNAIMEAKSIELAASFRTNS